MSTNFRRQPRVLLADDHTGILKAVRRTLAASCDVVGEVRSGDEVVDALHRHDPEIVVLDLSLPGPNGLDLCPKIKELRPATKIIVLTALDDVEVQAECILRGASAVVLKNLLAVDLPPAIQQAWKGDAASPA